MSNPLYQATVEALEVHLSPRVVSRALHEALRAAGRTPESVELAELSGILKGSIYRQLQVTMPVTQAKQTITELLDELGGVASEGASAPSDAGSSAAASAREVGRDVRADGETVAAAPSEAPDAPLTPALEAQASTIAEIRDAMRPFNLFFEWSEVQKLRSQVKLLDEEHEARREAPALVQQARDQLARVAEKLEDELVIQARDLGELDDALDQVRSLGGPKVRRLESLTAQIHRAQDDRQLAPAELERARKLARDLRKLMESTVYRDDVHVDAASGPPAEPGSSQAAAASHPGPSSDAASTASPDAAPAPSQAPSDATPAQMPSATAGAAQAASAEHAPVPDTSSSTPAPAAPDEGTVADGGVLDVDSEEDDLLEIDLGELDPEVSARLLALDLEGERDDLADLVQDRAEILAFRDDLRDRAGELASELDAGRSIAEGLADLAETLAKAGEAIRTDLRDEFTRMQSDADALANEVDTTELRQALRVAGGILETTLPSHEDVEHVRRLHRQATDRARTLARMREAAASHQAQVRAEQEALLARLEATLLRHDDKREIADAELAFLGAQVQELRDVDADAVASAATLADARRAEEALERVVAARSTDPGERIAARVRSLFAQIDGLPTDVTEHGVRVAPLRAELERQVEAAEAGTLSEADLEAVSRMVEDAYHRVRAAYRRRLDGLASRASAMGDTAVLDRLRRANDAVDDDVFPDVAALESRVEQAEAAHRAEQREALVALERRAASYAGIELPAYDAFRERVAEIRAQLDGQGTAIADVASAERLLDELERRVADRFQGFGGRIDHALERFERVARLNSDDVATVRRILFHLDSQRESFERVSMGLRVQLEASLDEAEDLLDKLQEDFEATREIADQLVSGNVIDDVLGLFDVAGDSESSAPDRAEPDEGAARAPSWLDAASLSSVLLSDDESDASVDGDANAPAADGDAQARGSSREARGEADRWIDGLARADGIRHAASVRADGVRGTTGVDADMARAGLDRLERSFTRLGSELGQGRPHVATFETADGAVVVAWPEPDQSLLLQLENPASLSLVLRELGRGAPNLAADGAALTAAFEHEDSAPLPDAGGDGPG